ncbi:serine hydrolase [Nonomuraea sp. NPDC049152]|uniref:serine hydrolase n=1 Tax=Nonomuraea sp. NPDC049152 TaxID=3154350 RepID=UPI00340E600C
MRLRGISLVVILAIVTGGCAHADASLSAPGHRVAAPEPVAAEGDPSADLGGAAPSTGLPAEVRRRLDRALAAYLDSRPGRFAVAVHDRTTNVRYAFRQNDPFMLASVAKVDILFALLLQAEREARELTVEERQHAALMIRNSDNTSAQHLFTAIGGPQGLSKALRRHGVTHTVPGYSWGATLSRPSDQVDVLERLIDPGGPLTARHQRYALGLLSSVAPEQAWGVSAAARHGQVALKNGWLPVQAHNGLWTINSVGRLALPGHELFLAVLSERNPDMGAGIETVERVARLAVRAFTGIEPPQQARALSSEPASAG